MGALAVLFAVLAVSYCVIADLIDGIRTRRNRRKRPQPL
jgi:hypothetical protein